MYSPRMKSLETCARAAGGAFGCFEEDFEPRYVTHPGRAKKVTLLAILAGFVAMAAAHNFGLAKMIAALPGFRAAV
ncbi:MAG: hypothetical protein CTY25_00670 [Methylobacterium sp.]|nr:MAG: hypothetical protein CTY25_00670 [Methylobacterium sp.]